MHKKPQKNLKFKSFSDFSGGFTRNSLKKLPSSKLFSWAAALFCWLLLSAFAFFVMLSLKDRARLIRDNGNERILNTFFSVFWREGTFAELIESTPLLNESLKGFAIYNNEGGSATDGEGRDGEGRLGGDGGSVEDNNGVGEGSRTYNLGEFRALYAWGDAPLVFDESVLGDGGSTRSGRWMLRGKGGSLQFIFAPERRMRPPAPPSGERGHHQLPRPEMESQRGFRLMRRGMMMGDRFSRPREDRQGGMMEDRPQRLGEFAASERQKTYFYFDIDDISYRHSIFGANIGFAIAEALLFILIFYARALYERNAGYKKRIEAQKNLVSLGTAAGALAHEIKNPLSSIRLQTGILEKTGAPSAELNLINEEIERISHIVYRINDYLRDARGEAVQIELVSFLREIAFSLCGLDIVKADVKANDDNNNDDDNNIEAFIFMDTNRARSVFENILRNALESGGKKEEISVLIQKEKNAVVITIKDRGTGIASEDLKNVFEPFWTTKSTGTGIGLAISKRFVEAAGGIIELENQDGLVVRVRLPAPLA